MAIGRFILDHDETVALGVKGEHGNVDLAVVGDVVNQIFERGRISRNSRGVIKSFKIGVEIEAGSFVQCDNFGQINGFRQLLAEINAGVPRWIASRARLELGSKCKDERKVYLLIPKKLVHFLRSVIRRRWFWRCGREPTGQISQCGGECDE